MTKMFLKPLAASFLLSLAVLSCSAPVGPSAVNQAIQGTSVSDRGLIGPTTYPTMYLRGSFNGWGALSMTQVSNYTWEAEATFTAGGQFKFDAAADWATNFGDNNADLTADRGGSNIQVPSEGLYLIRFNDQTLAYTITKKLLQFDLYCIPDRSVIYSDWEISGLSVQVYRADGTLDRIVPITVTTSHGSYASLRNPGILPGTYRGVVDQVVNGYRYSGETTFTLTNSQSLSPGMTITKAQNLEFKKTYPTMYLRGTCNSWGATEMTLEADYTWRATVSFAPGTGKAYKFDAYNNWSLNWGDTNSDMVGDLGGANIPVLTSGTVTIRFNDQTKAFSLTAGY